MDSAQLRAYLAGGHLSYHLEWLLRAATEWHVQRTLNLGAGGYHVQIFAMDSCFLHARALFEFFTRRGTSNHYGYDSFTTQALSSQLYADWAGPLHAHLMHAQDRSNPRKLKSVSGQTSKDLNQMPVDFAIEIVNLWKKFAAVLGKHADPDMRSLASAAQHALSQAISNADQITASIARRDYTGRQDVQIPALQW